MHESVFTELSIIIAIGAVISLIMRLIRQPLIIGYILTGVVVGPSVMNLMKSQETVDVFANIGVALLLFIVGLGLNPKIIREVGKVSAFASIAQIAVTTVIGYLFGQVMGYSTTESLLIGVALSFSSTIIVLKLLSDKKETTRLNGKIAIGILLIEDVVATLMLLVVAARAEGSFSISTLATLGIKAILMIIVLWAISTFVFQRISKFIASSQELLFLFAVGWGFGVAALFQYLGFSIEIGALFAGISLAALPYSQEVSSRLRPLRDFFIVIFFISLGSRLEITDMGSTIIPALILSLFVLLGKPLVFMIIMGLSGYTKSTSFKVANSLSQISEFSLILIIFAYQQHLVREDIISIMTVVALVTIAVSAYTITYSTQIYAFFEKQLALFERRKTKIDHVKIKKYDLVLFGYKKGGVEFIRVMDQLKKNYVVVDYDPEVVDTLERQNIDYIYGDVTDPELLDEVALSGAKLVVSTVTDHDTNIFLARWLERVNPSAVFICAADDAAQASSLYEEGAAYVMMPHYIGSEKIGSFIKKNGFNKTEFRKFREKHLQYLETHYT